MRQIYAGVMTVGFVFFAVVAGGWMLTNCVRGRRLQAVGGLLSLAVAALAYAAAVLHMTWLDVVATCIAVTGSARLVRNQRVRQAVEQRPAE
ncbi:hypothetical protein AB0950_39135 [Streptomyces sp. NPDC007189]|uniref:hypothetical protein n=1 Tax=Streptomyces sp. NPDC007189 TaxID=3154315 RepID=UPI003454E8F5